MTNPRPTWSEFWAELRADRKKMARFALVCAVTLFCFAIIVLTVFGVRLCVWIP